MPQSTNGTFTIGPSDAAMNASTSSSMVASSSFPRERKIRCSIRVATANVTTLAPEELRTYGLQQAPRATKLRNEAHEMGGSLLGLQEARSFGPSIAGTEQYGVVAGGSTKGDQNGCEL